MSEPRDLHFSRRGFLAAAGATAAAAGVLVTTNGSGAGAATLGRTAVPAGLPGRAPSQSASDDLKIAAFAASLEVVALRAYQAVLDAATGRQARRRATRGRGVRADCVRPAQRAARQVERILSSGGQPNVITPDAALQGVLDQRLPGVTDFGTAAKLARDLEEIAAATYLSRPSRRSRTRTQSSSRVRSRSSMRSTSRS